MAFVLTPAYVWQAGETVTATKLNLAATPTIASGQSYTFAAGSAAAPSISFTGATTTGFYLGSSAIAFTVAGISVAQLNGTVGLILPNNSQGISFKSFSDSGAQPLIYTGMDNTLIVRGGSSGGKFDNRADTVAIATWSDSGFFQFLEFGSINLCARATSDVVKTADTTLADLTGAFITVTAAGVYYFRAVILASATTTGGFRTTIDGTATLTNIRVQNVITYGAAGGTATVSGSTVGGIGGGNNVASTGTNATAQSVFEGCFTVNASGTIKIQVAQNNAAGATTFYTNSPIWAQRIS